MPFYLVRGSDLTAPAIAQAAGALYGVRYDHTAYAPVSMLDGGLTAQFSWGRFRKAIKKLRPSFTVAPDYDHHFGIVDMRLYVSDMLADDCGIVGVVPKRAGALEELITEFGNGVIYCISVPSKYSGFLPERYYAGYRYHLLGGGIATQIRIGKEIQAAGGIMVSADSNAMVYYAARGIEDQYERVAKAVKRLKDSVTRWNEAFGSVLE